MNARSAHLDLTNHYREAGLFTVEGFSNHLPMALGALLGLGARAEALHSFAARYVTRLPPAAPICIATLTTPRDVRAAFGRPERYADLLAYFAGEMARCGAESVQFAWLDELLQSPASTAFHSLIRLAYGRRFDHPGEIASGLADLASQRRLLAPPEGDALPISDALARLLAARTLIETDWQQPPISQRLREVAASHEFKRACAPLTMSASEVPTVLDALCAASIDKYLSGMSFTALHLVTACHALRIVLPALGDAPAALRAFWPAWAAAWVVARVVECGTPAQRGGGGDVERTAAEAAVDWPALVARTLGSDDDHVIKMVFTCKEEHERSGDPRYPRAAARLLAIGHS